MAEITKTCFKCGRELPLDEFYTHPGMSDGHLNKCKDCAKQDAKRRYDKKIQDPDYVEKERARGRDKYKRYRYGTASNSSAARLEKNRKYPTLRSTRRDIGIKTGPGKELHHWNYNLLKSVIVLPINIHRRLHQRIRLNTETGVYSLNGQPLDTIEKHLAVVREVCEASGYDFSLVKTI